MKNKQPLDLSITHTLKIGDYAPALEKIKNFCLGLYICKTTEPSPSHIKSMEILIKNELNKIAKVTGVRMVSTLEDGSVFFWPVL